MSRKSALREDLRAHLGRELEAAERAHSATVAGATHEEAKPENDKDTRALEQSYLARGQAVRAFELRVGLAEVDAMDLAPRVAGGERVVLGSLVTTREDEKETTYWVAAHGGGARLEGGQVQVVTPSSPLGRALIGKGVGDEADVRIGGRSRTLVVVAIE